MVQHLLHRFSLIRLLTFSVLIVSVTFLPGCGGGSSSSSNNNGNGGNGQPGSNNPGNINAINHVVFMLQENRSFDNYFGKLNDYRAGKGLSTEVDGIPAQGFTNPSFDGLTQVGSFRWNSICHEEVSPGWRESHRQFNRQDPASSVGLNDGFVYSAANYSRNTGGADVQGIRAMGYYDQGHLPYYYFMASQFGTSDRFFSSILTNTPANRLYSFAATSAGFTRLPTHSLNVPTIWSLLQDKGISWKIYSDKPGSTTLSFFQPFANQHMDHIFPYSQFMTDAKNGTLPSVAFIQNQTSKDEHPTANIQAGANFASTFINALMRGPNWKDSVFFLSYDEAGGIYDHVPPPNAAAPDNIQPTDDSPDGPFVGFDRYGFRIPFIVVSPFAKPGFVSHTVADNTAILKFIETRFGLSNLTARDAAQPDLQEFFDYVNVPNASPPSPPQQPTDGPCYYNHVP